MSESYELIKRFYGTKTAKRSGVPLINHINEGLIILDHIGANQETKDAYCLHPIYQNDENLLNYKLVETELICGGTKNLATIILYALEYRSVANEYLSAKVNFAQGGVDHIRLSPIHEVNQMLIADKVQNYKDFEIYHQNTHERSKELTFYFTQWLMRLGISDEQFKNFKRILNGRT